MIVDPSMLAPEKKLRLNDADNLFEGDQDAGGMTTSGPMKSRCIDEEVERDNSFQYF